MEITCQRESVAIVGMGYVGLTLASVLSDKGFRVYGYDTNVEIVKLLNQSCSPVFEPGVDKILKEQIGKNLFVSSTFPRQFKGSVIICVSTPIDPETHEPNLENLRAATQTIGKNIQPGSLVIVRSTVPVGTTRQIVATTIHAKAPEVFIAFCPERTIQGKALREIVDLPQIVSGIDAESGEKAAQLFSGISSKTILVSSLEAAEMIKLINNCHTDVIYSYGNEIALMAEELGLDAWELIHAANEDYPRPNLARPGFVGGGCLSKDPYILLSSFANGGYSSKLIQYTRQLNEYMPLHTARKCLEALLELKEGNVQGAKILICGFAYKGVPPTDDTRGTPALPIIEFLRKYPLDLYGQDFMVDSSVIKSFGVTPVDIIDGFRHADAAIFLNDHPNYRQFSLSTLIDKMRFPALIYDSWRILDGDIMANQHGVQYMGIGYG